MSYIMPSSWWWGSTGYNDRIPGEAILAVPSRPIATSYSSGTASERFWRQIRLLLFGFVGVATGIGSLSLYRYNSDLFLLASTGFTMLYTLLTLFASLRGQSPYVSNTGWSQAIEALSYFQLFNTLFVMLCVVEITFKTKNARQSSSSFGRSSNNGNAGNGSSGRGNNDGNGAGDGRG